MSFSAAAGKTKGTLGEWERACEPLGGKPERARGVKGAVCNGDGEWEQGVTSSDTQRCATGSGRL